MTQARNNPAPCLGAPLAGSGRGNHLESQSSLDFILQSLGNDAVKLGEDLHGELRIDALLPDQLVQGVGQGNTEAMGRRLTKRLLGQMRADARDCEDGRYTFHDDTNRKSYFLMSPFCLVVSPVILGD